MLGARGLNTKTPDDASTHSHLTAKDEDPHPGFCVLRGFRQTDIYDPVGVAICAHFKDLFCIWVVFKKIVNRPSKKAGFCGYQADQRCSEGVFSIVLRLMTAVET